MRNNLFSSCCAAFQLMRVDKPAGFWLLLWPTLWALWLATPGLPNQELLLVFILGTFLMRSAGCVINDLTDRKMDGHVARTCQRPLVTGAISVSGAVLLASLLLLAAFCLLMLFCNLFTIELAFGAILLTLVYPWMKRILHAPQAILGLAFSYGILMAFAATQNHLPLLAWLLYLATIFWIIAYDTEYAMVDRADDLTIGIKSLAITCGRFDRITITLLYLAMMLTLAVVGFTWRLHLIFWLLWSLGLLNIGYQLILIRNREPKSCFKAFLQNQWLGFFIFIGIVLGTCTK